MSLDELLPTVQELPHADKLRLMQWLAARLAKEEGVPLLSPDMEYPVWSPYDAHEATATLAAFLEEEKAAQK
jgi:hypothetical protein